MQILDILIILLPISGLALIAYAVVLTHRKQSQAAVAEGDDDAPPTQRRHQLDPNADESGDDDDRNGHNDEVDDDADVDLEGLSKKEAAKVLRKREKRSKRQAAQEADRERHTRKQDKESKYQLRIQEREQARIEAEEAERQLQAEKDAAEQAEFEQWKDAIEVGESGSKDAELSMDNPALLNQFIEYIKEKKVVVLEDLAAKFRLRSRETIDRVRELVNMGRLSGVIDDRGKFLYIAEEELQAVADFINSKGRISLSAIATASNKLIDLTEVKSSQVALDDDETNDTPDAAGGGAVDVAAVSDVEVTGAGRNTRRR